MLANYFSDSIQTILDAYQVQAIFLFGSQSTNTARSDSDIDLGIILKNKKSIDTIQLIRDLLAKALEPDRLDLVLADFDSSSPLLMFEITNGTQLYEQSVGLGSYIHAQSMHRYFDNEHIRNIRNSYLRSEYANQ